MIEHEKIMWQNSENWKFIGSSQQLHKMNIAGFDS